MMDLEDLQNKVEQQEDEIDDLKYNVKLLLQAERKRRETLPEITSCLEKLYAKN